METVKQIVKEYIDYKDRRDILKDAFVKEALELYEESKGLGKLIATKTLADAALLGHVRTFMLSYYTQATAGYVCTNEVVSLVRLLVKRLAGVVSWAPTPDENISDAIAKGAMAYLLARAGKEAEKSPPEEPNLTDALYYESMLFFSYQWANLLLIRR